MKKAIIACQALYPEITKLIKEIGSIRAEFLPQGLHNFVDSSKMRGEIQSKINKLEEEEDYDYIILGYGFCSKGVEGVKAKKAKLVIPLVHDCIPLLINKKKYEDSIKFEGTYFLSKGWIDYGGDVYKGFLAMTNQLKNLINKFKKYNNENREDDADWYEKKIYSNNKNYDEETAKWITYECIKNYGMIVLIDNENLNSIHFQYLEEKHEFLKSLFNEKKGHEIKYKIVTGDINFLRELIFFNNDEDIKNSLFEFLITEPGKSIELEDKLLNCNT